MTDPNPDLWCPECGERTERLVAEAVAATEARYEYDVLNLLDLLDNLVCMYEAAGDSELTRNRMQRARMVLDNFAALAALSQEADR